MDVLIGQLLVFILSAVSWVPFTLAVPYSLFIFLVYAPPPVYCRFRHCFYLSGRRDTSGDLFRCFKCGKFGHWAKDWRSMFWPGSYQSPSCNSYPGISYNKPTAGQSTQPKQWRWLGAGRSNYTVNFTLELLFCFLSFQCILWPLKLDCSRSCWLAKAILARHILFLTGQDIYAKIKYM